MHRLNGKKCVANIILSIVLAISGIIGGLLIKPQTNFAVADDLISGVYFIAGKTKIRNASNYEKVEETGWSYSYNNVTESGTAGTISNPYIPKDQQLDGSDANNPKYSVYKNYADQSKPFVMLNNYNAQRNLSSTEKSTIENGDAYLVGSGTAENPYILYTYDTSTYSWQKQNNYKGIAVDISSIQTDPTPINGDIYLIGDVSSGTLYRYNTTSTPAAWDDISSTYEYKGNYETANSLPLSDKANIDNFYVGFGTKYEDNSTQDYYLSNLTIATYLSNDYTRKYEGETGYTEYGVLLQSPQVSTNNILDSGINTTNHYWYNYFDLNNIQTSSQTGSEFIFETDGLYTIVFNYTYMNNGTSRTGVYVYQFYLLQETSYIEYPDFDKNLEYKKNDNDLGTYYYSYQTQDYPVYIYNATKYNVSYAYQYGNTYNYTSTFSTLLVGDTERGLLKYYKNGVVDSSIIMCLDTDNNKVSYYNDTSATLNGTGTCDNSTLIGSLTINKVNGEYSLFIENIKYYNNEGNGVVIKNGAKNTNIDYIYALMLPELGSHTITNKYVVSANSGEYAILDDVVAVDVFKNYKRTDSGTDYEGNDVIDNSEYDGYYKLEINGDIDLSYSDSSVDGQYSLVNYGVRSYFYKNNVKMLFAKEDEGIYAEQSHTLELTSGSDLTDIKNKVQNLPYANIPVTNLQPIYFDYYGTYDYTSDSSYASKYYRYTKGNYGKDAANKITLSGDPTTKTFTPTTTLSYDGLYIVEAKYNYSSHLDGIESSKHTQYFVFIIDNIAPTLSFSYKNNTSDEAVELTTNNGYTNKNCIYASWQEPNYFQGNVSANLTRYDITGSIILENNVNYANNSLISANSSNQTYPGKYEITLKYGISSNQSSRKYSFVKDISIPTANINKVTKSITDAGITTYNINNEEINNRNIFNDLFVFVASHSKTSGAKVDASYVMVPFDEITTPPQILNRDQALNIQAVTTNYAIDASSNLFETYTPYSLNDYFTTANALSPAKVLGLNGSMVYIFRLFDEAGNEAYFYYIYDTTQPKIILLNENDEIVELSNSRNIVNNKTTIYWGTNKAISINNNDENQKVNYTNFINYVTANPLLFNNLNTQTIAGETYLFSPLKNAKIEDNLSNTGYAFSGTGLNNLSSNNSITDRIMGNGFTVYLPSQIDEINNSSVSSYWNMFNTIPLSGKQYFATPKNYSYEVYDNLGNVYASFIEMKTDKANFMIDANYIHSGNTSKETNISTNARAYNANSIVVQYETSIRIEGEETFTPLITYDYYPFSVESYITDVETTEKIENAFSNTSYNLQNGSEDLILKPSYPFSSVASKLNESILVDTETLSGKQISTSGCINAEGTESRPGLYVFKRVYLDNNGDQVVDGNVGLGADDRAVMYYAICIDQNKILDIKYQNDGEISTTTSIGDYISMMLGHGSDHTTQLTANVLQTILSTSNDILFETNKVNVQTVIPFDKYATQIKLNNPENTLFEVPSDESNLTEPNEENINSTIATNQNMFKLFITLKLDLNSSTPGITLIDRNTINLAALGNNPNLLLLNQAGTYTLTISDNAAMRDNNKKIITETANVLTLKFKISHTPPSGRYASANNDVNQTEISLPVSGTTANALVNYISTNDEVLKFSFSDPQDEYTAKINPNKITITRTINGLTTTLLSVNENLSNPETIVTGTSINDVLNNVVQKTSLDDGSPVALSDTTTPSKYTFTIFNNYSPEKTYLSTYDINATYSATIQFIGDANNYKDTLGNSFYTCTYVIYVDKINPHINLDHLKDNDKNYTNQNVDSYCFAVSNNNDNPTIFNGDDSTDSVALYYRKLNITSDLPSLLPDDENYYDYSSSSNPRFSELSRDYKYVTYDEDTENISSYDKIFSFSALNPESASDEKYFENGHYEIIEKDEAGNYTKYYIYVGDNTDINLQFNYIKTEGAEVNNITVNTGEISTAYVYEFAYNGYTYDYEDIASGETETRAFTGNSIEYVGADYDYEYDSHIITTIYSQSGNALLGTITSDPFNEEVTAYFERVKREFDNIANTHPAIFQYRIVISNRFSPNNYVLNVNLPGDKLQLTITDTSTTSIKVDVPGASGTVHLVSFKAYLYNGTEWPTTALTSDLNKTITTTNPNGLSATSYNFAAGQYKFVTVDNYGREVITYKYVGAAADGDYSISYKSDYIVLDDVITTSGNIELLIDNTLWIVEILCKDDIEDTTTNWRTATTEYTVIPTITSKKRFILSTEGYYQIKLRWATSEDPDFNITTYKIDKNKPNLTLKSSTGGILIIPEGESQPSYTEKFYIYWESNYSTHATLIHTYNSRNTIIDIDDVNQYYVENPGKYILDVYDEIGNLTKFSFIKTEASFTYFAVSIDDRIITESALTNIHETDNKTIHYYYVTYNGTEALGFNVPEIEIIADSTKGIESELVGTSAIVRNDDNKITNVGNYNEYKLFTTAFSDESGAYILCYIRIVFVLQNNDFADLTIYNGNPSEEDSIGFNIDAPNVLRSEQGLLTLRMNSYHYPIGSEDYKALFVGNKVFIKHTYNNSTSKIWSSNSFTAEYFDISITAPGLHCFEIYDLAGNSQLFNSNKRICYIYLLNDILFTVNDKEAIPNAYFNDNVTIKVQTLINNEQIYSAPPTVTITRNGKVLDYVSTNNIYLCTDAGYYTVTITGSVNLGGSETKEQTKVYVFTILDKDIAQLSFNISSSYGFTITKLTKNNGNILDTLTTRSSLWLSSGEANSNSGIYNVTATYYSNTTGNTLEFSFIVWINESTPAIVPYKYSYGTSTSKVITLQYDPSIIYSQVGRATIKIINQNGETVDTIAIDENSKSGIMPLYFNNTGEYRVALYNNDGRLISSYKVIKTTPLNASAKIFIFIACAVVIALIIIFIFIRRRTKFR